MSYASLSLDLDNQWSYMKTHGDRGWESHPSYLDVAVPRILEFLAKRRLTITFFIVGQDAAFEKNRQALRAIAAAGHEIGNHSFHHEPWLHLYSESELETELLRAEDAIEAATGIRPRGFRGPGFSLSASTLEVLARKGYEYDATVFPNLLNPLARAYLFATSNLTPEEKKQRSALFGTWKDALRPVRPFHWQLAGGQLLEIPVTTLPWLRVPLHLSYLLYLGKFSRPAARTYFRMALGMCRLAGTQPSILLHPLDFLGKEDCPALAFFPGMDLPRARKLALVGELFDILLARVETVTMREHARRATAGERTLATLAPVFRP
ncbi:MAG: polysaccharide deacetylase family protein [Gammaproteobacteria bacterium]|nr:polysaccharide deacetylase family protein [Gammaproteobacteria bacterium]